MEEKLKLLIEGNNENNRSKWATEWKKQGKKVIGLMSSYVPEEVVLAAGMLPWRITGTWQENISHARVYRAESSCGYCNHLLESFLNDEFPFLDGVITTDQDDDLRLTWELLKYKEMKPFCFMLHVPFFETEENYLYFATEIRRLIKELEDFGHVHIDNKKLLNSIQTCNKMRDLLSQVYEFRKREKPPLSGAEILGIVTSAQVMPKDHFNQELEQLLPYIGKRQVNLKQVHPRLLVLSEMLDNPEYIKLVEEGCLVAMDDMDTGSRYMNKNIDNKTKDPVFAIAKSYISRHGAPFMADWKKQSEQIIKWVKEYNIDGVLSFPNLWCYPQRFRDPYLKHAFEEANIPFLSLAREYHLANVGQLKTRAGAFSEMLSVKK